MTLKATEQPIDTSSAAGKATLDMLGVFAEFETNLRKEGRWRGLPQRRASTKQEAKIGCQQESSTARRGHRFNWDCQGAGHWTRKRLSGLWGYGVGKWLVLQRREYQAQNRNFNWDFCDRGAAASSECFRTS